MCLRAAARLAADDSRGEAVSTLLPGMYIAVDSTLHHLDPRVKLVAALLLMAVPFATHSLTGALLLLLFVALLVLLSTIPLSMLLRTLRPVLWLALFLFLFYLFTTPGQALVRLGSLCATRQGAAAGGLYLYRLLLLVSVAAVLTYTTSPGQLAQGLEALLAPLARLGLPVREFNLVLTIALRFVPTLFDEVDNITKAQRARGLYLDCGPPWQRMRGWVTVFVPLFVSALRRAEALSMAMEARGFFGVAQRTHLRSLRLTTRDGIAAATVLVVSLTAMGLQPLM